MLENKIAFLKDSFENAMLFSNIVTYKNIIL